MISRILTITALSCLQTLAIASAQVANPTPPPKGIQHSTISANEAEALVDRAYVALLHESNGGAFSLNKYRAAYNLFVQAEAIVDQPRTSDEYALKAGSCFYIAQLEHFVLENLTLSERHYRCAVESATQMGRLTVFIGPLEQNQILAYSYKSLTALFIEQKRVNEAYEVLRLAMTIDESHLVKTVLTGFTDVVPSQRTVGPMGLDLRDLWLDSVLAENLLDLDPGNQRLRDLAWLALIRTKGRTTDMYQYALSKMRDNFPAYFESYTNYISALSRDELAHLAPPDSQQQVDEFSKAVLEAMHDKSAEATKAGFFTHTSWNAGERDSLDVNEYTTKQINDALPDGAAIIEYVKYANYERSNEQGSWKNWGESRYGAFVKAKNKDVMYVQIPQASKIEARVKDLRLAISLRIPEAAIKQASGGLGSLIFTPLEPLLKGLDTLFFVTDGALEITPMAAVCDQEGRYLVETYSVSQLGNPQEIRGRSTYSFSSPIASRSLVIGDPDFGPISHAPRPDSAEFGIVGEPLEFENGSISQTDAEVREVASTLGDATPLRGKLATEEALKTVHGPKVLHVATHGYYLDSPDSTYAIDWGLFLAPWSHHNVNLTHSAPVKMRTDSYMQANFVDSAARIGIALADANTRKSTLKSTGSRYDDGILTGMELTNIDLRGTDIATLSACETGLGQFDEVDGISSFEEALKAAGSRTQIISLWQVNDLSTREFMNAFYKRALGGAGTLQAFRDAQLQMLRGQFSHPYYWAAFSHWGAWGPITCIRRARREGSIYLKSEIRLTVNVRDAATGNPIPNATVEGDYPDLVTDRHGFAVMHIGQEHANLCEIENGKQPPRELALAVERFGYEPFREKLYLSFDQHMEVRLRRDHSVQPEGKLVRPAASAPIQLSYINLYGAIGVPLVLDSLDGANRHIDHAYKSAIELVQPDSQQLYLFWKTWRFRDAHPLPNPTWQQLFADDSQFILYKSGELLMTSSANPAVAQYIYSHSDGCGPKPRGAGASENICPGPLSRGEAWDQIQTEAGKVGFLMLFIENTSEKELNDVQIAYKQLVHGLAEAPIDAELADRKTDEGELQRIRVPDMKPHSSVAWLVRVFVQQGPEGSRKVISNVAEPVDFSYSMDGASRTVPISVPFIDRATDLHLPTGYYGD